MDADLSAKDGRVMKNAVDRLMAEINERTERLYDLDCRFGFLLDMNVLIGSDEEEKVAQLKENCIRVGKFYNDDLDGTELFNDVMDCRMLFKDREGTNILNATNLSKFIVQYGDDSVFPNLRVAIQIMLTVAISIASCERSSAS